MRHDHSIVHHIDHYSIRADAAFSVICIELCLARLVFQMHSRLSEHVTIVCDVVAVPSILWRHIFTLEMFRRSAQYPNNYTYFIITDFVAVYYQNRYHVMVLFCLAANEPIFTVGEINTEAVVCLKYMWRHIFSIVGTFLVKNGKWERINQNDSFIHGYTGLYLFSLIY